ncbi:hypothetical protein E1B28_003646 [Marasmius oreades]|uniref:F-box domain-containing protein n=1 Tax=Marasmius oreades TaxID=181124 RepID=A0A9P7UWZ0_9AGAR|nr:uncharacterized protein E1B28_003646 [Marasmius oreades]KAG7096196.1 hypothetical protein E1B28_003646 [Marasmius oreades]
MNAYFSPLPRLQFEVEDMNGRSELAESFGLSQVPGTNYPVPKSSRYPEHGFGNSRVPFEILSHIFDSLPLEPSTFSLQSIPWTLSRVCRFWRTVAFGTPSLWTSIYIDTEELTFRANEESIQMLCAVIDNSKNRPLDVTFRIKADPFPFNPPSRQQILFDMVRSQRHRWRSLTLYLPLALTPQWTQLSPIFELPSSSKPPVWEYEMLESIQISGTNRCPDYLWLLALHCAPALKRATLSSIDRLSQVTSRPVVPWNQLLHLDISSLHAKHIPEFELLLLLSQCTSIQTLVVRNTRVDSSTFTGALSFSPIPLQIPSLHTLEIHIPPGHHDLFARTYTDQWLTSRLVLPELQTLILRNVRWDMDSDLSWVVDVLKKSECTLRTLSIAGIDLADVTIGRLLRSRGVRKVTELTLEGHPGGYLFNCITGDQRLLPDLEVLRVCMAHTDRGGQRVILAPPIRSILNLVQSRKRGLKVVNLELFWHAHDNGVAQRLRELGNVSVRRLEYKFETPSLLRDEMWTVRQLGGIFQKILVLSHPLWNHRVMLFDNMPAIGHLLNELERLLQSIVLTDFTDAELTCVEEVHCTLQNLASSRITLPRDVECKISDLAKSLLERFPRPSGENRVVGRENEKQRRGLLTFLQKRWRAAICSR